MSIKQFVKKKAFLFWSTKNTENLSEEVTLEHVLNYGDFTDVKEYLALLGIKRAAAIFRKQIRKKRNNYKPVIKNYFEHYFNKYA